MNYLFVKFVHVVSSTMLFGTGIGSAYYLLRAVLDGRASVVASVARWVVVADWLFTATTIVLQPLSGWWLAHTAHFPFDQPWLRGSIVLYLVALACWLPVVWLQMRMRDLACEAAAAGAPLPPAFRRCFVIWFVLGFPALFAFLGVFYLMVAKPA
ncbi:MAG TPA: DUF2269 domain-containing protein [Rudaea sp.]